ncbi:OV-16 antigen [Colletotrichum spinosum]|uniref:OV-16 antigen n=1 Tax=Colletotrichum spinosum TaxID=1347390 RepID=A0A4R8QLS5_9PEZI|nr:OV-16 antigen [Colletotrichum spinosum]
MKVYVGTVSLLASWTWASPLAERQVPCPGRGISSTRSTEVRTRFRSFGVIPDSVPDINATTELQVKYGNIPENLGNVFTVPQTLQEPIITFDPERGFDPATTKYTYIQVDPDAPGPKLPLLRHFLHHIVYDLQASCIANQSPKTQARYMPLTPLSVSPHRYVSLLYRQVPGYKPPPLDLIEDIVRAPFDLQQYVDQGNLMLVGGNFMREGLGSTVSEAEASYWSGRDP